MTAMRYGALFLLIGAALFAHVEAAPSFDCHEANAAVEKLICADAELADLDREMNRVFNIIKTEQGTSTWLTADQGEWLKQRASNCAIADVEGSNSAAAECLAEMYELRITKLRNLTGYAGPALTDIAQVITPLTSVPTGEPGDWSMHGSIISHRVIVSNHRQGGVQLTQVDPVTGKRFGIDIDVGQAEVLFADADGLLLADKSHLFRTDQSGHVQQRYSTNEPARAATVVGTDLLAIEGGRNTSRLESFELGTGMSNGSYPIPDGVASFWGNRIVVVTDSGIISTYSRALQPLSKTQLPVSHDDLKEQGSVVPILPAVYADYLLLPLVGDRTCVFDLKQLRVVQIISTPGERWMLRYDISGDLLFVLDQEGLAIYDLASHRALTRFHLTATDFMVDDGLLTIYTSASPERVSTYKIDIGRLRSRATLIDSLSAADMRARAALARTGSVYEALKELDGLESEVLLSSETPDPRLREIAADYASWLASTIARRQSGIAVLERLYSANEEDAVLKRKLGAAYLRDYLIGGDDQSLSRSRNLLSQRDFPAEDLSVWQSFHVEDAVQPLDLGPFVDAIYFSGNTLFVTQDGGPYAATIRTYDRNAIRALATYEVRPVKGHDIFNPNSISALTFRNKVATVWMGGEALAVTLDETTGRLAPHKIPGASIFAVSTDKGDLSCSEVEMIHVMELPWDCSLLNPKTFRLLDKIGAPREPFAGSTDEEMYPEIAARVLLDPTGNPGQILAGNERWTVMDVSPTLNLTNVPVIADSDVIYRDSTDTKSPWRAATAGASSALLSGGSDTLILVDWLGQSKVVVGLDLSSNVSTTLTDLAHGMSFRRAWAIGKDLLLIADGHDLLAYDLRARSLAAVVPQIVSETEQGSEIESLRVDGDHLFILTRARLTQFNRLVDINKLRIHADVGVRLFKASDNMLTN